MTIDKYQPRAVFAAALGVLLITALIIVFNGGISIGLSNHAGLLPVVRRILDSNYLPGDFGISLRFYHHRVFAFVVAGFSALMGEDNGLIALSVIATLLLSASLYILCRTLNLGTGGFIVAGLFLATKLVWTGLGLEENNFSGNADVMPTTFSHAFILLATSALISSRYRLMGLFAGLAMLFHFQIGLVFALVLIPLLATRLKALKPGQALAMTLLFVVSAVPAFLHFAEMLRAGLANSSFTLDYINFRHPHHFKLFSSAAAIWVAVHVAVQIAASYWLKKRNKPEAPAVGVLMTMSLTIAALSLLHFLDYYVLQIGTIAKLQLLRLSPLITVFGAISFVLALGIWEKEARLARGIITRSVYAGLLVLVLASYLMTQPPRYYVGIRKYAEQKSGWADACRWIRNHGPVALYITPPDRAGFTYLTDRSTVVEYKINPDGALYLSEWYERLRDVCGGSLPEGQGYTNNALLRRMYGSLTEEQLSSLARKYRAGCAVLPASAEVGFETLYQNDDYKVVLTDPIPEG